MAPSRMLEPSNLNAESKKIIDEYVITKGNLVPPFDKNEPETFRSTGGMKQYARHG